MVRHAFCISISLPNAQHFGTTPNNHQIHPSDVPLSAARARSCAAPWHWIESAIRTGHRPAWENNLVKVVGVYLSMCMYVLKVVGQAPCRNGMDDQGSGARMEWRLWVWEGNDAPSGSETGWFSWSVLTGLFTHWANKGCISWDTSPAPDLAHLRQLSLYEAGAQALCSRHILNPGDTHLKDLKHTSVCTSRQLKAQLQVADLGSFESSFFPPNLWCLRAPKSSTAIIGLNHFRLQSTHHTTMHHPTGHLFRWLLARWQNILLHVPCPPTRTKWQVGAGSEFQTLPCKFKKENTIAFRIQFLFHPANIQDCSPRPCWVHVDGTRDINQRRDFCDQRSHPGSSLSSCDL